MRRDVRGRELQVLADGQPLSGILQVPSSARGLVVFAHGSGSSRLSPRNRQVADALNEAGRATYLTDLLLPWEADDRRLVFDVRLLGDRLLAATAGVRAEAGLRELPLGYFGASTGAAAALVAAAELTAATNLDPAIPAMRRSWPGHEPTGFRRDWCGPSSRGAGAPTWRCRSWAASEPPRS